MKCLELIDVSYQYEGGTEIVLKKINASFENGKLYTIVGQSGAGKSTLLSLISGLDSCREGEIRYKGKSLREIDRDEYRSRDVGVIFQGYNLLLNSSAVYNITLSMEISRSGSISAHKPNVWDDDKHPSTMAPIQDQTNKPKRRQEKKEFAYSLLAKVGIDRETADRKILRLSGGEQQRVGIARALSHNPDVIIADEPTGNLDVETEGAILEIFTRLAHEDDKCVIIVTHSDNVTAIADKVLNIRDGKL